MNDVINLRYAVHSRATSALACVAWTGFLTAIVGCGELGPETYVVRGTVTYQDEPVEGGIINFFPAGGGQPLGGPFDEQGQYEYRLPSGPYSVIINAPAQLPENWQEGDPLPQTKPRVPTNYAHPKRSGLSAEITAEKEPQIADFRLR